LQNIGDVYTGLIYYRGTNGQGKRRPILIIDYKDNWYTIVELTTTEPKKPPGYFDTCKQEIVDWSLAGLDEQSWAKCHNNNIHRVDASRLIRHLGSLEEHDLIAVLTKIAEINL
jgi:hypothetical protein